MHAYSSATTLARATGPFKGYGARCRARGRRNDRVPGGSTWEGIKNPVGFGVQRVRESNIEQLRKELSEIRFKDGKSIDDFSMQITGLANSIITLGGSISETEIVKKKRGDRKTT